jgi:UDP:flavonoid glycosyltransferase YjiC (YdhE family)
VSRFLLAWELGSGYGHLARLLPIAEALRRRGHDPVLALRDLQHGRLVFAATGWPMLQAPVRRGPVPKGPGLDTYPGILIHRGGYGDADSLATVLRAWLDLLAQVRPDLLVADFSPTAVLAARAHGLPCVAVGSSYLCPPRVSPLPAIPGRLVSPQDQLTAETRLLQAVNQALARCGSTPLASVLDMFPPVEDVICTFPELDQYGTRADATYWGAIERSFGSQPPVWPPGVGANVFAYLDGGSARFRKLLADLGAAGNPVLVHARGVEHAAGDLPRSPSLAFSSAPLDLDRALGEADLAVCHGSHGLVTLALLNGVPLVLIPTHREQATTCDRVVAMGAGLAVPVDAGPAFDCAALVERALADPRLAVQATSFAATYRDFDPQASVERMVDFFESLL